MDVWSVEWLNTDYDADYIYLSQRSYYLLGSPNKFSTYDTRPTVAAYQARVPSSSWIHGPINVDRQVRVIVDWSI